jgi:2-amino-4-hydroxy-6-hydroxymethyldihydropteridine diphosphokinase
MTTTTVYVSLGGNVGHTPTIFREALQLIEAIPVSHLRVSSFYQTSPVYTSSIPAVSPSFFINAVCCFNTALSLQELLKTLQAIERQLGKIKQPKEAPRTLDLDILFFGSLVYEDQEVQVPHPRWLERLFVLIPLAELTSEVCLEGPLGKQIFNIPQQIAAFPPDSGQIVSILEKKDQVS